MQDKPSSTDPQTPGVQLPANGENFHPLRSLSAEEFAALGGENTVFVRSITARELAEFLPEAEAMPGDVQFQLIMAANGAPILVTDSATALSDWFDQNEFNQVQRH